MSKRQRRAQRERRQRAAVVARRVGTTGGLAVVATLVSGAVAEAETLTVTNTNASPTYAGSLGYEITAANTAGGSNTIVFKSGLSGSIDLANELPKITAPLTITGPGANVLTIHGSGSTGVFYIAGGLTGVTISGLGITGGQKYAGGGVVAGSPLTLRGDHIYGNMATGGTSPDGGGVFAFDGLSLYGSTISGNTAVSGGGVWVHGSFVSKYSTIADNTATTGGGINAQNGAFDLFDSTVSGNMAPGPSGHGGGIFLYGGSAAVTGASVYNTIISGDTAVGGADVYTQSGVPTPTVKFSSIGTTSNSNITPDSTDQVGVNPLLGPLQNNGGTTPTMAPAFNSPVIDKGDQPASPFSETTDQRGLPRPVDLPGYPNATGGDGSDMGAVELQASEVVPAVSGLSPSSGTAATSVVISGSRLSTATGVTFGTTPVPFSVNSSGQIVTAAPAGLTGSVDVRVTTPGGQSATTAADQFTYKSPAPPPPPPPPSTQTTSATFGDQHVTLTSPASSSCVAGTSPLKATLTSASVATGTILRFSSAGFFIDKGIKHTKKKTEHLKNGKTKKITVTTWVANAVVHGVPTTVSLSLSGVKSGSHTLRVVISYKETVTKHHKKKTITVTKTVSSTFTVC